MKIPLQKLSLRYGEPISAQRHFLHQTLCIEERKTFFVLASLNNGHTWTPQTKHIQNQHDEEQVEFRPIFLFAWVRVGMKEQLHQLMGSGSQDYETQVFLDIFQVQTSSSLW